MLSLPDSFFARQRGLESRVTRVMRAGRTVGRVGAIVVLVVIWPHLDAADPVAFCTGCKRWSVTETFVYGTSPT